MLEKLGRISPALQRLLLIAGCAVLFCVWLTWVPLGEVDEVRFTEATREMLASGDYIIPHYNYEPRYQKPILFYWIQAASMRTFGVNEVAARLPSGIFAILLVLMVHGFLLRWLGRRALAEEPSGRARARGAALLAAVALATAPLIAVWSRAAATDVMLTFFLTGALLALLEADLQRRTQSEETGKGRTSAWYLLAALCAGLAAVTKGPIGLAIPGLVWLLYHLRQRTLRIEGARVPWTPALVIFFGVAAPWYAATYVEVKWAFLKHFFITENIGRYSSVHEGHGATGAERVGAIAAYLLTIIALLYPYCAFFVHELIRPFAGSTSLRSDDALSAMRRFALIWALVVVGTFAGSSTQLPNYVQSICPAVAMVFALHLLGRLGRPADASARAGLAGTLELVLLLFIGSVLVLVLLAFLGVPWAVSLTETLIRQKIPVRPWMEPLPQVPARAAALAVALFGVPLILGALAWGLARRPALMIGWTAASWTGLIAVMLLMVAPLFFVSMFGPGAETGRYLRSLPTSEAVYLYAPRFAEDLVFYSRRRVEYHSSRKPESLPAIREMLADHESLLLVTDEEGLAEVRGVGAVTVLKEFPYFRVARLNRQGA